MIEQAAPRSTTEMLRYVPGFTRVESSGGEVNQNISMRGILGVEYVMFMEDGLPVFPTMHTFFMNADNLFRADENIERMEIVRGGSSALFGSNTPGAIVNFINKTGGDDVGGSMRVSTATAGLARYDLNLNGPLGEAWKFNLGGFYRYDRGVRHPGYPGVRGGQIKGSVTRSLRNGYVRASVKVINDRNQFILPLPFQDPTDPKYVPGFSDDGAMNTREGNHIRVLTPTGELELPLDDGLRTDASWVTADAAFDFGEGWRVQNTAQLMRNDQGWNAILPFDVMTAADFIASLNLPAGSTNQLFFTNVFDNTGTRKAQFNTPNGLVSPSGLWHVEKPLTAFQDQLQLKRTFGVAHPTTVSAGLYFANYTQGNRWFFTDILTNVADNTNFLDVVSTTGGVTREVTKNGFRNFLGFYVNGSGQTDIVSPVIGASIQLTPNLRADAGVRYERNDFVQSVENTSRFDLDGNAATTYDNETYGNGTFRHFDRTLADWATSLGFNYLLSDRFSVYASGSRGYKMPALDEFLFASSPRQVALFDPRETQTAEGGLKFASGPYGVTVNGFYAILKNIVSQGAVTNPTTGEVIFITVESPENRSYGLEVEASASPLVGLQLLGTGTYVRAELGSGAGADIGSLLNGVPRFIGNIAARYTNANFQLSGDLHHVGQRFASNGDPTNANPALRARSELPTYDYFNFGAAYRFPSQGMVLSVDLLNAFQSKGLEEGNPRLSLLPGGRTSNLFLARPLLPRRVMVSLRYDF